MQRDGHALMVWEMEMGQYLAIALVTPKITGDVGSEYDSGPQKNHET